MLIVIHKYKYAKYKRLKQHYNSNRWLFDNNLMDNINIGMRR